jgi:PST family polysaccharide transporter
VSEAPVVESSHLAGRATRAFGWSFLNTALSRLGTLLIGIVLARVLGPTEFGTFAVATVALLAVLSFNELGVSLAIVRWRGDPRAIAPTVTTISLVASTLLFVAMYVSAPVVASALGDPEAAGVVRLMSVAVIISGAVATPAALLQRDFRQKRRLVIDQVNTWVGAGLSLTLALAGWGAWSLAVGRVVASLLGAALYIASSSYPYRVGFDRAVAGRLLGFGLPLAGTSLIVFGVGYAEQMIAGSVLGATALGFYVLAFNLASWPVNMFSHPLRSVAPAAFARLQGDEPRMSAAFVSLVHVLALVTLPVCATLAAAAPHVVQVVYGDAWAPAAPVLRLLALLAMLRILFELAYDYLVVLRRSGRLLTLQLVWLAALVPALWYAAHAHGLAGVAAGQLVVVTVVVLPLYLHGLASVGVTGHSVMRAVLVPALASLLLALVIGLVADRLGSALQVCAAAGLACVLTVATLAYPQRHSLRAALGGAR